MATHYCNKLGGKIYPRAGEYFYAKIEVRIHTIIGRTRRTLRR